MSRLRAPDLSDAAQPLLVKQKTKGKIKRLAEEPGYSIDARKRNLRKQSSQALGIIIAVGPGSNQIVSNPFFFEMMVEVSEADVKRGYDLIIRQSTG